MSDEATVADVCDQLRTMFGTSTSIVKRIKTIMLLHGTPRMTRGQPDAAMSSSAVAHAYGNVEQD